MFACNNRKTCYTFYIVMFERGIIFMYKQSKPMLNLNEQINHLKNKGIKFELISEVDAKNYLKENSNYFKLTSYRKNFFKYENGENIGKYINLDFKMLIDIAIIDMRFRKVLLSIILDLEHYIKMKILNIIENSTKDGYTEVDEYITSLKNSDEYNKLEIEISKCIHSAYCGEITQKYNKEYPIWVFIEIIPFGRLINFYMFLAKKIQDKKMIDEAYLLKNVRELRNACAHNNCILNDLHTGTAVYKTNYSILRELSTISIARERISKRMSNIRIQQIVTLLYLAKKIITSNGVLQYHSKMLNELEGRINHHLEYYSKNLLILGNFTFLNKIIDSWYTVSV